MLSAASWWDGGKMKTPASYFIRNAEYGGYSTAGGSRTNGGGQMEPPGTSGRRGAVEEGPRLVWRILPTTQSRTKMITRHDTSSSWRTQLPGGIYVLYPCGIYQDYWEKKTRILCSYKPLSVSRGSYKIDKNTCVVRILVDRSVSGESIPVGGWGQVSKFHRYKYSILAVSRFPWQVTMVGRNDRLPWEVTVVGRNGRLPWEVTVVGRNGR